MVVDTRDIDLLVQNLLPAAEVQACLKVLPGLYGADACKSDFLSSVAFATNDDALQTEAVAAMISVAWQQMRGTTALDIGLGFLTLAFLIYTSYAHRNAQPLSVECLCAAAVLHAKTSIEEMRDIEREREKQKNNNKTNRSRERE
ncbi:Ank3 [Symbiodinium sp. KB8]|nr:Ank3 [Symbiodinium sp. KB8]